MVNMYIQKGRIEYMNGEEAVFHCGTYLASLKKGSPEYVLVAGLIQDSYQFLDEGSIESMLRLYRRLILNNPLKRIPLRAAKVLPNLLDGHLFLKGSGNTRQEAICSILDQVSLWPFAVPGTESEDLPYQIPNYFAALQDKDSLPPLEKNILNIVTGKALVTRDLSPRETHGEESHKKYYVTMETLCRFFCANGETKESVYQAVQSLYEKHCIYFNDKVPFELYKPFEPDIAITIYRTGEDLGLPTNMAEWRKFK